MTDREKITRIAELKEELKALQESRTPIEDLINFNTYSIVYGEWGQNSNAIGPFLYNDSKSTILNLGRNLFYDKYKVEKKLYNGKTRIYKPKWVDLPTEEIELAVEMMNEIADVYIRYWDKANNDISKDKRVSHSWYEWAHGKGENND